MRPRFRDMAEYDEAPSTSPQSFAESLEDEIREAAEPVRLSDDVVARIAKKIRSLSDTIGDVEGKPDFSAQAKILSAFIEKFSPSKWSVANWWAILFVVDSKYVEGRQPIEISKMLGMSRMTFHWMVKNWRKKLNIPKSNSLWRESTRIGQRKRRLKNQKTPVLRKALLTNPTS